MLLSLVDDILQKAMTDKTSGVRSESDAQELLRQATDKLFSRKVTSSADTVDSEEELNPVSAEPSVLRFPGVASDGSRSAGYHASQSDPTTLRTPAKIPVGNRERQAIGPDR